MVFTTPRPRRRQRLDIVELFVYLAIGTAFALVSAAIAMWLLGVMNESEPAIPALGFWNTFGVGVVLRLLIANQRPER